MTMPLPSTLNLSDESVSAMTADELTYALGIAQLHFLVVKAGDARRVSEGYTEAKLAVDVLNAAHRKALRDALVEQQRILSSVRPLAHVPAPREQAVRDATSARGLGGVFAACSADDAF